MTYVKKKGGGEAKVLGFKSLFKLKLLSRLHNYPADHWKRPHSYIIELSVLPARFL